MTSSPPPDTATLARAKDHTPTPENIRHALLLADTIAGFPPNAERDGERWPVLVLAAALRSAEARVKELEGALGDLMSWFPEKPEPPTWSLKGGPYGADDAVAAARAALSPKPTDD